MRRFLAQLLIVCFVVVTTLVFLLLHGADLLVRKILNSSGESNRTALPWIRKNYDGLIFIGDSRDQLHEQMTDDEADIALIKFLSRRHVACERTIRLGNVLDGGWDMCIAGPYHPQKPCLVYSFGINNDFSFDDAIGKNFGCTVRSFDPSMSIPNHQRNANVWFYRIGIGGQDTVDSKGWAIRTLSSLMEQFNDSNRVIDYLKMDVEGSEWPSIGAMFPTGILKRIKQFGIEVHIEADKGKMLYDRYRLLQRLEDAGFRRWYYSLNLYNLKFRRNGFRSCCYEMVYLNTNFLKDYE